MQAGIVNCERDRMKSAVFTIMIFLCGLISVVTTHAQAPKPSPVQPIVQAKIDTTQEGKVLALQAEVQVMKDFMQNILSTVYFALATVVVVLIAMVGFGWYQNFRVFERDKEALRQSLLTDIRERIEKEFTRLDSKATERFQSFDENIAKALERTHQGLADVQLMLEASIFHASHAPKTPRTDFMVFSHQLDQSICRVSSGVLDHALSTVLDYVQTSARIDPPTRTSLLKLAGKVAAEKPEFGERLREILNCKPD